MKKTVSTYLRILLSFLLILPASGGVRAKEFVQNGGFENTTGGSASFFLGNGPASLDWWSRGAPPGLSNEIVFAAGAADNAGATRSDGAQFGLWGPGNGVANGLTPASPAGGNFVAFDGDTNFNVPLNQNITGLRPGRTYTLSFLWAGSQYRYINGPPLWTGDTTESWQVSLGAQTFTTPTLPVTSQGFTGWQPRTSFIFTPGNASELLSFLAVGGPNGLPPVALLDGVSLVGVPEPGSLLLVGIGLLVSVGFGRFRAKSGHSVMEN